MGPPSPSALGYSAADTLPSNSPTALQLLHVSQDCAYATRCRLPISSWVLRTSQAALEATCADSQVHGSPHNPHSLPSRSSAIARKTYLFSASGGYESCTSMEFAILLTDTTLKKNIKATPSPLCTWVQCSRYTVLE
jgi:hypothetical protein